jgi:hypothetical protein
VVKAAFLRRRLPFAVSGAIDAARPEIHAVRLATGLGGRADLRASACRNSPYVEQTMPARPSLDASITGRAVTTGELVHLEAGHPLVCQYVTPDTPSEELEALIVAPLLVAGRAIGSLNVRRERMGPSRGRRSRTARALPGQGDTCRVGIDSQINAGPGIRVSLHRR